MEDRLTSTYNCITSLLIPKSVWVDVKYHFVFQFVSGSGHFMASDVFIGNLAEIPSG